MILKTQLKGKFDLSKYRKLILKNESLKKLMEKEIINHNSYSEPHSSHRAKIKIYEDKIEKLENYKAIISNENSQMLNSYSNIQKIFPSKVEDNLKDIIIKYEEKGYKKLNYSLKNNIFKENPLLINNNKITDYYEEKRKKMKLPKFIYKRFLLDKKKDKYLCFLEKESKLVNEELNKHKKKYGELNEKKNLDIIKDNNKKKIPKKSFSNKNMIELIKERALNIKIKEENKQIKEYNEKIEKIIPIMKKRHSSVNKIIKLNIFKTNSKLKIDKKYKTVNLDDIDYSSYQTSRSEENSLRTIFKNENKNNLKFITLQKNKTSKKIITINKLDIILSKLKNENNQYEFLSILDNINLLQLERKDLEFIIKIYCKKFLKYNDFNIQFLLKPKSIDNDLVNLIKKLINRTKNYEIDNYLINNRKLINRVHTTNNQIKNFQKKICYLYNQ